MDSVPPMHALPGKVAESAVPTLTPDIVGHGTTVHSDGTAPPQVPSTSLEVEIKPEDATGAEPVPQVPDNEAAPADDGTSAPATDGDRLISPFETADAPGVPDFYAVSPTDSAGADLQGSPSLDGSRQHHLLRHSLPNEQRGHGVLAHFGVETISDAAKIIKKMSQRELQAKFKAVYGARTFSNNNNWLRRKLFEAIGLDPSKGAVKKPGAGTQRRRRPASKAAAPPRAVGPRLGRRASRTVEMDEPQPIAEALLALGELASLAYDGYDLDELEEAAAAVEDGGAAGSGSDGRVPSAGPEDQQTWSAEADAGRGVPRAGSATPEMPAVSEEAAAALAAAQQELAGSMGPMFEWIARMQRQALEAAGPHHAAAVAAALAANPAAAAQVQQLQALQMAAMAGHPTAQQLVHGIMTAGAMGHPTAATQLMPSPEALARILHEAAALAAQQQGHHHVVAAHMQSLMAGGQLVPPMFAGHQ